MLRILHIAPFNTAGVPMAFVKAERSLGFESRLVTFARNEFGFEEDWCLDLPFMDGRFFRPLRNRLSAAGKRAAENPGELHRDRVPLVWKPSGTVEATLTAWREKIWEGRVRKFMKQVDFFSFDVYQFDGGLDFSRHGLYARALHEKGKKVVCCYLGSDLRIRGVIHEIDALSDCNFTVEYDHLALHPDIHYLFLPFESGRFVPRFTDNDRLRIFHSATSRLYKGSDHIIDTCRSLERDFGVEFIYMENAPHAELLQEKQRCDIMIDQITNVGGVGYGVSSLEALAMGLAVCTRLTPDYEAFIPDHPFISVTPETLYDDLAALVTDNDRRLRHRTAGRAWVEKYHDAKYVVNRMHDLYRERGWFTEFYV